MYVQLSLEIIHWSVLIHRFITACHSLDYKERQENKEFGKPVRIGDHVWIGGNVTIVTGGINRWSFDIGAGSVVTKDIPANVIAVGNPCKVIKDQKKCKYTECKEDIKI